MIAPRSICVTAPAKINLTLHITGQRNDGYHLLDTLVVFADVGDTLRLEAGRPELLTVSGPEAGELDAGSENLVIKVARLFENSSNSALLLEKNLPVSSGIGGGSADAAAAFRGLVAARYGVSELPRFAERMAAPLLALGADIPMCLRSEPLRVRGVGEDLRPIRDFPRLHAVLVNPRRPVSTPAVFKALVSKNNPAMPEVLPQFSDLRDCISWLATQRNDLEPAAQLLEPSIARVQEALSDTEDCLLVRMSGSGATCFGLYPNERRAAAAAAVLRQSQPDWWIEATQLGSQADRAVPRVS